MPVKQKWSDGQVKMSADLHSGLALNTVRVAWRIWHQGFTGRTFKFTYVTRHRSPPLPAIKHHTHSEHFSIHFFSVLIFSLRIGLPVFIVRGYFKVLVQMRSLFFQSFSRRQLLKMAVVFINRTWSIIRALASKPFVRFWFDEKCLVDIEMSHAIHTYCI